MKKIKIFLGGYINSTNAQNLSCLTLAEYIDKNRFEVYALEIYNGNLKRNKIIGVKTFFCFSPFRLSGLLGYFWGISKCDVAFLPRGNMFQYNKMLLRLLNKKSFKTIENVLDDEVLPSVIAVYGSLDAMKEGYSMCDRLYSITHFMKEVNFNRFGIISENKILRLATDTLKFSNPKKQVSSLKQVVFIGNDMIRKGIFDLFSLAQKFPILTFNIVGSGLGRVNVESEIAARELKNVKYFKVLDHKELIDLLSKCELHILPSKSEGFPKVILETAAAGVPSLLYSDYGALEWIKNWETGIVVDSLNEMVDAIQTLINVPGVITRLSEGAISLSSEFDIHKVVKDYEEVIVDLHNS
ncbi:glycosyltransferase family 4 protein [Rufibacter latericius]|uniref:Glycosyltransferase n=1 Tax=Rufibacter latericius TaxID=2487040 RepID=A0A3M9MLI4_9BACT|nr:glycosyltransferase family 4 protein [Rufibacter latericius]RNI25753.1 glycosyltransferase [Rufibacter latericius]